MKRAAIALAVAAVASGVFAGRPVARWDVVPYQRVSGVFNVGVVAFHDKGVKVEFSVNGRKCFTAAEPTLNKRTGVKEYVLPLPASRLRDGIASIGATAIADGAEPYELPELPLYLNEKGTYDSPEKKWADSVNGNDFAEGTREAPYKTLKQAVLKAGDGGTVYLLPGEYSLKSIGGGLKRQFWTLVTTAEGVDRSQVRVTAGRTGTEKLRFRGLNFYSDLVDRIGSIVTGEAGETMAWFEDCLFTNTGGRYAGVSSPFSNRLRAFVVGGETVDMATGPYAEIVRSHKVSRISGRAFAGSDCLVANCTVDDVDSGNPTSPSDFFSAFAAPPQWVCDVVLYGVKGTGVRASGMCGRQLCDSAFVDVALSGLPSSPAYCRFSEGLRNVLFDRVSMKGQLLRWMSSKNGYGDLLPEDVVLKNCEFGAMDGYPVTDGSKGLLLKDCKIGSQAQ